MYHSSTGKVSHILSKPHCVLHAENKQKQNSMNFMYCFQRLVLFGMVKEFGRTLLTLHFLSLIGLK